MEDIPEPGTLLTTSYLGSKLAQTSTVQRRRFLYCTVSRMCDVISVVAEFMVRGFCIVRCAVCGTRCFGLGRLMVASAYHSALA
jgi:hypothetical protein